MPEQALSRSRCTFRAFHFPRRFSAEWRRHRRGIANADDGVGDPQPARRAAISWGWRRCCPDGSALRTAPGVPRVSGVVAFWVIASPCPGETQRETLRQGGLADARTRRRARLALPRLAVPCRAEPRWADLDVATSADATRGGGGCRRSRTPRAARAGCSHCDQLIAQSEQRVPWRRGPGPRRPDPARPGRRLTFVVCAASGASSPSSVEPGRASPGGRARDTKRGNVIAAKTRRAHRRAL